MLRTTLRLQNNLRLLPSKTSSSTWDRCLYHSKTLIGNIACSDSVQSHTNCSSFRILSQSSNFIKINGRYYSSNDALPSHQKIQLPALSPTMEMGTIISWEKKEGDKLNEGDLLAEIETDKATMGFETPDEGYLAKILVPAGSKDIPLGRLLCIIVENEEDIAAFKDYTDSGEAVAPSAPSPTTDAPPVAPPPPPPPAVETQAVPQMPPASPVVPQAPSSGRIFASPLARKLASEKGIDIANVSGSGPSGRIRAQDIEAFKGPQVAAPAAVQPQAAAMPQPVAAPGATFVDIPVTPLKQEAARQAMLSKQTIPHYYLTVDVIMDEVLSLKKDLNMTLEEQDAGDLNISDMLIKASALACMKVPEANSSWQNTFIRQFNTVDINVVMSAGDNSSVTPIVRSAEKKGLVSINSDLNDFSTRILDGSLQQIQSEVGTFTVSSLGMFGVKNVINIITPPQACCLGVGAVQERLVPDDNETGYKTSMVMSVTLSCDHRVIDGAVGAQWLQHFKKMLEKPHLMLL